MTGPDATAGMTGGGSGGNGSGGNGSGTNGGSSSGSGNGGGTNGSSSSSGIGNGSGGGGSGKPDAGSTHDAGAGAGGGAWTCPPGPFGSPIPAGATAVKIAGVPPSDTFNNTLYNFTSLEGPVWIGDALYVSEYPGNPNPPPSRILKITSSGEVTVAVSDSGSIGLAVD